MRRRRGSPGHYRLARGVLAAVLVLIVLTSFYGCAARCFVYTRHGTVIFLPDSTSFS